jgi:hypothetical protein
VYEKTESGFLVLYQILLSVLSPQIPSKSVVGNDIMIDWLFKISSLVSCWQGWVSKAKNQHASDNSV